ncbi:MAG: PAS domain S-box protein, partial [bacterium]
MTENKKTKKTEPSQSLRIAAVGAIIIIAVLVVGIINTVFSPGMSNTWAILLTGLIFFLLGIVAWETAVNRTGKVRREFEKHAEILENSRDTFRTIAGSVPFPLALLCGKGRVSYFNTMFQTLFDVQEGDSPDLDIHDLIHPEDRGDFRLAFFDCMRYRNFTEKTEVRLSKNGNVRYYEVLLRPLSSKVNDTDCCLALFRDLTSEKAFEKTTSPPQQIDKDTIEESSAGIFSVNRNGEIESINEAALKILELDSTYFEGKNIFDDDLPILEQLGMSALLGEKAPNHSILKIRVGRFMEKSITCSLSIWPVLDNEGAVTRTFFMIQNLTSELQSQTDLNTSQHGRYFLFDEAGDAIFVLNSNGEITMANPSAVELTGYDTDELSGMNFTELFTAEEREKALRQSSWLKRKRKINFESKFLDANGKAIDVEISASMVKNSDGGEII